MFGARLRYKKCWEACHEALQQELLRMTIDSDPSDARVLSELARAGELDAQRVVERALTGAPKSDCMQPETLASQLKRLVEVAAKVEGLTQSDIERDAHVPVPPSSSHGMDDLPRKLI